MTLPLAINHYWDARNLIAFERRLSNGNHDIFVMRDDGSDVWNLTDTADADDGAPAWSPNGRLIAFSSDRVDPQEGLRRAIFQIEASTGTTTQLTSGEYRDRWPTWSPDGQWIYHTFKYRDYPADATENFAPGRPSPNATTAPRDENASAGHLISSDNRRPAPV